MYIWVSLFHQIMRTIQEALGFHTIWQESQLPCDEDEGGELINAIPNWKHCTLERNVHCQVLVSCCLYEQPRSQFTQMHGCAHAHLVWRLEKQATLKEWADTSNEHADDEFRHNTSCSSPLKKMSKNTAWKKLLKTTHTHHVFTSDNGPI